MSTQFVGLVPVHYHRFWIGDRSLGTELPPATKGNGLVEQLAPGSVCVFTGIHTGRVSVATESLSSRPEQRVDEWEHVAETSIDSPEGFLAQTSMFVALPVEFPNLTPDGPGLYRIRVHCRGRDVATDLSSEDVVEAYLLQIWPVKSREPDAILKAEDGYGSQFIKGTGP